MRSDDKHRSCRFEAYTSLDSDNGVTHMHITSDSIWRRDGFYRLYSFHLIVEFISVHADYLTFIETDTDEFAAVFGHLLQICRLRKSL